MSDLRRAFRGITAPASLKLIKRVHHAQAVTFFPGHNSPGLIEAFDARRVAVQGFLLSGA